MRLGDFFFFFYAYIQLSEGISDIHTGSEEKAKTETRFCLFFIFFFIRGKREI